MGGAIFTSSTRIEMQFAPCAEQLRAAPSTQAKANVKTQATGANWIKRQEAGVGIRIE
jgi:hypothetical protein